MPRQTTDFRHHLYERLHVLQDGALEQALDDFQQFLHDHSDALVAQQSADGLEVRGPHKVPVGAIDVAVGNVERLGSIEVIRLDIGGLIPLWFLGERDGSSDKTLPFLAAMGMALDSNRPAS